MSNNNFDIIIDLDRLMSGSEKFPDLANAIERGIKSGISEFGQKLADKVIENIAKYGLEESTMQNQLDLDLTENGVSLVASGEYIMYVEFGTGVVGKDSSHPMPSRANWSYDTKGHGDSGWWYPSSSNDPNPTKYKGYDGWWAWTKGMGSRPFMYDTWLWASRSANNIITKHINIEIRKLGRGK